MNVVVHHGALGDWVLTFALLRRLAPEPTLAVAASSKAQLAARLMPHVSAASIDHRDGSLLFAEDGAARVTGALRERLGAARRLFSFVSSGGDAWAANVRSLVPRECLCCFIQPRPPADWPAHVCDWHEQQWREQGCKLPDDPGVAPGGKPGDDPRGPVVIHPGSGGAAKCWPRERFEMLIERLTARGEEVRATLGEVEMNTWPHADVQRWITHHRAACVAPLEELATLLAGASRFIGNDAGPTHLAAQMGVPTVALFGPSNPTHWSPRGPCVNVLAPPAPCAMEWLSVEAVAHAAAVIA